MLPEPFTRNELLAAEREPVGATVWRGKPAIALRYALAPACIGVATLLHLSPVGPLLHPMGLFILGVVAAAWFGGAGPGVFAAFLSAIVLPHLIAATYPLSLAYPLLAGFFDLPRFVTLGLTGAAVGWGTSSYRRAQAALRERERLLTKARDELETAVAERTAHLSASEEALRRSEQRYALAMEAAGDGHTDWNLETGEFYISPRLLKILGYAPGTTFADRADWVRRFPFHPEDRPRWEAAVAAHFAGRDAKFRMDLRIVVNGETRWVAFTFIASRDASGKPVRWTGSIADINDAKLAEEALRESQERYALAVAGSDDGVWDCDFAARRVFVSARARELAGMPPGPEMVPMDEWFASLPIHPEDVPRRVAAMEAHLAGEDAGVRGRVPPAPARRRLPLAPSPRPVPARCRRQPAPHGGLDQRHRRPQARRGGACGSRRSATPSRWRPRRRGISTTTSRPAKSSFPRA